MTVKTAIVPLASKLLYSLTFRLDTLKFTGLLGNLNYSDDSSKMEKRTMRLNPNTERKYSEEAKLCNWIK